MVAMFEGVVAYIMLGCDPETQEGREWRLIRSGASRPRRWVASFPRVAGMRMSWFQYQGNCYPFGHGRGKEQHT